MGPGGIQRDPREIWDCEALVLGESWALSLWGCEALVLGGPSKSKRLCPKQKLELWQLELWKLELWKLEPWKLGAGALEAGALGAGALGTGALEAGALGAGALGAGALGAGSNCPSMTLSLATCADARKIIRVSADKQATKKSTKTNMC